MTRAKVTDEGVVVPKHFFGAAGEVEISQENGTVVLRPVSCGLLDASEDHDEYAESVAALREAINDMENGDTGKPMDEFVDAFRKQHNIPPDA